MRARRAARLTLSPSDPNLRELYPPLMLRLLQSTRLRRRGLGEGRELGAHGWRTPVDPPPWALIPHGRRAGVRGTTVPAAEQGAKRGLVCGEVTGLNMAEVGTCALTGPSGTGLGPARSSTGDLPFPAER